MIIIEYVRRNDNMSDRNRFYWWGQIFTKYPGPNGRMLLQACHQLFDMLPLCALIQASLEEFLW